MTVFVSSASSSNKTSAQCRCAWAEKSVFHAYHDDEWGHPVHDDRMLFEFLILEGAQAGLSWETVLKKRDAYREIFHRFDPVRCAALDDAYLEKCLLDERIIRNRLKVFSVRKNAVAFLAIVREFGSFDRFLWDFCGGQTIVNRPDSLSQIPASTELSDRLSKVLKKRGFTFVGSTIVYAFLQAVGIVDDHERRCFRSS